MESEDVFQVFDHLRRQNPVGVKVISFRLALHLLSLIQLGVTVVAAQSLQLAQNVLEAGYRVVALTGLYQVLIKRIRKERYTLTIFAERSVTLDWLILLREAKFQRLQGDQNAEEPTLLFHREGNGKSPRHRTFQ